jgi:hypothetical protein
MRFVFLTNTPAHVHLYKHAVDRLTGAGHDVLVLGRDYGCTEALLSFYDLPYEIYGKCGTQKLSLFRELPRHYLSIFRHVRRFEPDLIFGMGGYAAHAGLFTQTPVILILDSEPTTLDTAISRPFARYLLTPSAFQKDLGSRHREFEGFKESAYLHPDVFQPRKDIRERLGVGPEESYVMTRFNAFGSHHDIGQSGFTPDQRREFIERIAEHATVFVSDEGGTLNLENLPAREYDLHPALMHDALAEAHLLVADTQTMVTEAALLGTPAIRSNSFVGDSDMGNFQALEEAGLIDNVAAFDDVLDLALERVTSDGIVNKWDEKRRQFVAGTVNLTDVIVDIAENEGAVEKVERVHERTGMST